MAKTAESREVRKAKHLEKQKYKPDGKRKKERCASLRQNRSLKHRIASKELKGRLGVVHSTVNHHLNPDGYHRFWERSLTGTPTALPWTPWASQSRRAHKPFVSCGWPKAQKNLLVKCRRGRLHVSHSEMTSLRMPSLSGMEESLALGSILSIKLRRES